jgi:hypothetical protein
MKAKKFEKLLGQYIDIANSLLEFTDLYWDDMSYDIDGFRQMSYEGDYDDLPALENQVKAFEMVLDSHRMIRYTFC